MGDVVKIARFHNSCPVVEFQYRQGQILNVRAEKTSERVFYDALTSALSGEGQRFQMVDYACAESVMLGVQRQGDDVKGVAPYYAVFIELSDVLQEEERKNLELKVGFNVIFRSVGAQGLWSVHWKNLAGLELIWTKCVPQGLGRDGGRGWRKWKIYTPTNN